MSLTKRLWNVARANLSDFTSALRNDPLDELSEEERAALDEELKQSVGARAGRRARQAYETVNDRVNQARPSGPSPEEQRRRWYKTLELQPGATYEEVRKAYRKLLRKYHPDKFAQHPEKYKAATEVTRNVTEAYEGLSNYLRR